MSREGHRCQLPFIHAEAWLPGAAVIIPVQQPMRAESFEVVAILSLLFSLSHKISSKMNKCWFVLQQTH